MLARLGWPPLWSYVTGVEDPRRPVGQEMLYRLRIKATSNPIPTAMPSAFHGFSCT